MRIMDVFISALTKTKMSKAAKRSVEEAEASVKKAKTGDDKKEDVEDEEEEGEEGEEEDDDEEGEGVCKLCMESCKRLFFVVRVNSNLLPKFGIPLISHGTLKCRLSPR